MESEYFAVTTLGVEPVATEELKQQGATQIKVESGGISFKADLKTLYKIHLWSRTIHRVLKPIKDFAAINEQMLYDQIYRVKWEDIFRLEHTFCIDTVISQKKDSRPNRVQHTLYASQKIKDAIVDRFRDKTGDRPSVDKTAPDFRIHAYFHDGRCRLSLDASGRSLHERGYRAKYAPAPLKETLAAAIVMMTGYTGEEPFVDGMCGSGTLAIEAAMIALKHAPGLGFRDFSFLKWRDADLDLFNQIEADAKKQKLRKLRAPIYAYDSSIESIRMAKESTIQALGGGGIDYKVVDFLKQECPSETPGIIVMNPPYGDRLKNEPQEELDLFYKSIGDQLKHHWKNWNAYIFTGNLDAAKRVGLRTKSKTKLFNGPIECRLLHYPLY